MMLTLPISSSVQDRDAPGAGFTHKPGDVVTIGSPRLGRLVNRVGLSDAIAPWTYGLSALMHGLARRGLLGSRLPNA
jgi:fumarylacetoacetate (FAA) hydrolase family protein